MFNKKIIALAIASTIGLAACNNSDDNYIAEVDLRVIETTDLHANIMDYNYYQGREDKTIGLARTASLIHAARAEVQNSVLVDNGDLLQGSPMGDYIASEFNKTNLLTDTHPAYKAMNMLDYDVGNIGNHEFNYGLEFLEQSIAGANFPYISANVICAEKDGCWNDVKFTEPMFKPYLIKDKDVFDTRGHKHTIKVGYIGFVPPQIMTWDKAHLTGKVEAIGIVQAAEKYIPMMKQQGADVIVAIPHSGIGSAENPGDVWAENATYALTNVAGIDAIMFGHSHSVFPNAKYADLPNTDVEKGLLNGVPAVMPGRWGDNLGVVDLKLRQQDGVWTVFHSESQTQARPIYDNKAKEALVEGEGDIRDAVEHDHNGTLEFVNQPIGVASANMYSFLSLVQDDPTVQIVSNAQMYKVNQVIQNGTDEALKQLPVLSASAPFKAGGRYAEGDASQYVLVDAGDLTYKNAADLYLYPNTMVAVKVTGAEIKDWLECSANQFNQIDPTSTAPQNLINRAGHPTYNFDVIDGISYQIDVTQPSKFDRNCAVINADANRVVDLTYMDGETAITGDEFAQKEFVIASNNYRAFGGAFAGTGPSHVVLELPDANREALAQYITVESQPNGNGGYDSAVDPKADLNWDFKTISTSVQLDVRFETQDSQQADEFIENNQRRTMKKLANDANTVSGFAIYSIDLQNDPVK